MGKPKARGNGQGTAIKRGAGWEARVVIGWKKNKENTKSLPVVKSKGGFKTKKEALAYCSYLKLTISRPEKAPSLKHYWDAYQTSLEKLSKEKQVAYKIAWNKMESIWYRQIDTLSVTELRTLVEEKAATYYPARDMKVVLTHLFKMAGADQWVDKSVPEYIELPQLKEKERTPFTAEEQKNIWKAYEDGNKDAAIPLIMIYTGMMTGELRKLSTEMIDLKNKKISGVGMKTKVRRDADIYLATSIVPVLQDIMADRIGLLYPGSENVFYKRYYEVLEAAGCRKLSPYSCRHTTATALAIDENIAPQTIKKVMRWSTAKMLDRYAHPKEEDASAAVERIGAGL